MCFALGALFLSTVRADADVDIVTPTAPEDIFQEVLTSAQLLQFSHGYWWSSGAKLLDKAPYVLRNNDRSYATISLYGEGLAHRTTVEFVDESQADVQDIVSLPVGSGPEIVRTLPITSASIRIRIAGSSDTTGTGRVMIKKVVGPAVEGDRPESLTVSLPLISFFASDPSMDHKLLANVGRSVVFIQIAEPRNTNGCTGFLVRKNVVATAAHCLRDAREAETGTNWRSTICRRIGITFDFRSGAREKDAGWSTHCSAVLYLDEKETPNSAASGPFIGKDETDLALLAVDLTHDNGVGAGMRPPLTLGVQGKLFSVIQHPQGDPQRVATNCPMEPGPKGSPLFLHRCPTAPGSSGAPVLSFNGTDWRVFGIHTCCARQPAVSANTPTELHDSLRVVNFGIAAAALEKALASIGVADQ